MITLIYNLEQKEDYVNVKAVVEDCVEIYPATNTDPAEYGPALCESSFYLEEDEILPQDEDDLIEYLENLNLDWQVLPRDFDL
jgi:hypothetical protein